jgi:hypothetical protein
LHRLVSSTCTDWFSRIATDAYGDGFVYGDHGLLVTHDHGLAWVSVHGVGSVLQVVASHDSVWLVSASCAWNSAKPCPVRLLASKNRGVTWFPLPHQPVGVVGRPAGASGDFGLGGHSYLARVGTSRDFLLSKPRIMGPDQRFPLWESSDSGGSWHEEYLYCRPDRGYAYNSVRVEAAPNGTLWAACTGEPGNQMQGKSIYVSTDGGRNWSLRYQLAVPDSSEPMGLGLLSDMAPISTSTCFVALAGNSAFVTHDGGRRWLTLGSVGDVTGSGLISQVIAFSPRAVWIGGSTNTDPAIPHIWKTGNGGRTWTAVTPTVT